MATAIVLQIKPVLQSVLALLRTTTSALPSPSDLEAPANSGKKPLDFRNAVLTFCFGGGLGIPLASSVEVQRQSPISFVVMSALIALAFSFVFVSDFILAKHPVAAGVLELMGVLFAAAALFTALCIPPTTALTWVVWTIFAGAVAGIFIINFITSSSASSSPASMDPTNSTFACLLLHVFAAIASTIKSAALALLKPILAELRRVLVPPSFPDPETEPTAMTAVNCNKNPVDWRQVVVSFCFAGGVGLLSVSVETRCESPTSFLVMSVLIALAFWFVFVSDFILAKHPLAAGALEFMGVMLAAAALFTALCIPLTTGLTWVVWTIFAIGILVINFINFISSSSA